MFVAVDEWPEFSTLQWEIHSTPRIRPPAKVLLSLNVFICYPEACQFPIVLPTWNCPASSETAPEMLECAEQSTLIHLGIFLAGYTYQKQRTCRFFAFCTSLY